MPKENENLIRQLGKHEKKQKSVPTTLSDVDEINKCFCWYQTARDEDTMNYYRYYRLDVTVFECRMGKTE